MRLVDASLFHRGERLDFGPLKIMREIARGANGIVYLASDALLQRDVAVKVWTKLNPKDKRDKIQQGILESRNAHQVSSKHVVQIHQAGITADTFFVVMEYIQGLPLRRYLKECSAPLRLRISFAEHLLETCDALHQQGHYHGDLHPGNVMIEEKFQKLNDHSLSHPDYKLIDFGTSYFSRQGFSLQRHVRLIVKLVSILTTPFDSKAVFGYEYPKEEKCDDVLHWLERYLRLLRVSLVEVGYKRLGIVWVDGEPFQTIKDPAPRRFTANVLRALNGRRLSDHDAGYVRQYN